MKTRKINRRGNGERTISLPPPLTSHKPGDNFYKYVNGNWLRHASIPDYKSSFGISEEIEAEIQKDLFAILEDAYLFAEKGKAPTSKEEKMKDILGRLALSTLRPSKRVNCIAYLKEQLLTYHCIRTKEEAATTLGKMSRLGIDTFFRVSYYQDTLYLGSANLGLPDLSYYSAKAPGKSRTLVAYIEMCRKISQALDIKDITQGIHIESQLAVAIQKSKESINSQKLSGNQLSYHYKDIPWQEFFTSFGLPNWKRIKFHIPSLQWIHFMNRLFRTWTLDMYKEIFTLHTVIDAISVLPAPYDEYNFELYGKRLRGQQEKLPQKELLLLLAKQVCSQPLSILYVSKKLDRSLKPKVKQFVEHIQSCAIRRIQGLPWLDEHTKKTAVAKLEKMILSISHPSSSPDIVIPSLDTENLLYNLYALREMNTMKQRHTLPLSEYWEEPAYTVNAYYNNQSNQFILPAGSLYVPFFYKTPAKMGWNYGSLGAMIGHEFTHAFDIDGKEYNELGQKKNWWTLGDNRDYNKRTRALVKLFGKQKVQGRPVDGAMTLSENISDLGGLGIALDALKEDIKGATEAAKKEALRDFFTGYAVSWRIKEREKKALQGLFLDVHAPTELRVNLIVSQFDEWYSVFGVKTEDDLFLHPEERVRIF
jgi:putative endopeptidase